MNPAESVESSSQSNLEVTPSISSDSSSEIDWASRLDAQFEAINEETGDTRYGKPDEPKSELDEKLTRAQKQSKKAKPTVEKTEKKSVPTKKSSASENVPDVEPTETEEEKTNDVNEDASEVEETPKMTEKAAAKWGDLKKENSNYKKEIETLKAELEKVKATAPSSTEEIEQLKQINSEYERELSAARIEATQEYKTNVVEPMVGVMGFLGDLAKKYDLSQKDFLEAMAESDPSRQSDLITDLASSMNERDRLKLYGAADDYAEIIRRRDYYQSSSRERMAQIEAERNAELAKQKEQTEKGALEAKEAYQKATSKVFEDLKKSVPILSDDEVAADVQRLANGDYSNATPELKSYLAHSGALLPHLLKSLREAKASLESANKTIASYRNGSPKAGRGSADNARAVPEDIGFLDALEQQLS